MTDETTGAADEAPTEEQMLATIAAHGTDAPAPKPKPEPKAEAETNELGDEAAAATPEGEAKPAKPKQTAQERFDELTRARREAEREADRLRGQIEILTRQPTGQPKAEAQTAGEDAPPNPDDYVYGVEDAQYDEDRIAFFAAKAVKAALSERDKASEAEKVNTTYAEKEKAFAAQNADFNEVVVEGAKNKAWSCSPAMDQAMLGSDNGPALAYHLAKNPDESHRIAALPAHQQFIEMGKLEAKLSTPAPSAPAAPTPKTVTDAPEPAPALRGTGGQFKVQPDTADFAAFDKAY